MLLPNDSRPENTLYCGGADILRALIMSPGRAISIADLFALMKDRTQMTSSMFILCLDWLYLVNAAEIDGQGAVRLCI